MVIPTLGHAYAGEWSRAMPFLITDVFGVYLCSLSVEESRTYGINRQQSSSQLEIKNKEMFYNHFTDQSNTNKWESNIKLENYNIDLLPKYLKNSQGKYKEWFSF